MGSILSCLHYNGRMENVRPRMLLYLRRSLWAALLVLLCFFVLSAGTVLALRWLNPPWTAYMLETQARLSQNRQPVQLRQQWVPIDRVSGVMSLAVVASEDQTFPFNHGFDLEAIQNAIQYNAHHENLHGASTITQQTAKNLFLWPAKTYFRKIVGAWFTILIDVLWPKKRVLEVYLNIAQFGDRIFGVKAAAHHYFGIAPAQLSARRSALLAAVLPAPAEYSVTRPSPYVRQRANWIMNQMQNLGSGYLTGIGVAPARLP